MITNFSWLLSVVIWWLALCFLLSYVSTLPGSDKCQTYLTFPSPCFSRKCHIRDFEIISSMIFTEATLQTLSLSLVRFRCHLMDGTLSNTQTNCSVVHWSSSIFVVFADVLRGSRNVHGLPELIEIERADFWASQRWLLIFQSENVRVLRMIDRQG